MKKWNDNQITKYSQSRSATAVLKACELSGLSGRSGQNAPRLVAEGSVFCSLILLSIIANIPETQCMRFLDSSPKEDLQAE